MTELRNMTLAEMQAWVQEQGQPKFRAAQLFDWIYKGITDFREMRNLPGVFLQELENSCRIDSLKMLREQKSALDGTRKYLFELADGNTIETVFMQYKYGNSICISSQAGCRMGCKFCASGLLGLKRNLTAGEMISQVLDVERETGEKISNLVIMGTGEPMDNYENLSRFLEIIHEPKGFNFGYRNITVSTCGLVPEIEKFGDAFPQVNLAISLHQASDEGRSNLMPINRRYPLKELVSCVRKHADKTGRRVTFEYTLIKGQTDREEDIEALADLLSGMLCHVNLIPLNAVRETGLSATSRKDAEKICEKLEKRGIPATVRRQLGADIDGACGQLRLDFSKKGVE